MDNLFLTTKDGTAVGSPLGPAIAGIFMVELEKGLLPMLSTYISSWKRYVDDTFGYIKTDAIDYVLCILNSFHGNISFIYEEQIRIYNVNPPIAIFIYTGNHSHQVHGNQAHLEH